VTRDAASAPRERLRRFPPSLAGACLRYAVMDLLGFGRALDAETRAHMAEGAAWHKAFQQALARRGRLLAAEAPIRDVGLGVSGRIDALIQGDQGPAVVEYKTVSPERFLALDQTGRPPEAFWAQLALYLAVTGYREGYLVIAARDASGRVLVFRQPADAGWAAWVVERVRRARGFQELRRLPPREVSRHCLSCDRWQRCFADEAERDRTVADHPEWEPVPPLPPLAAAPVSMETVWG
jgi:hypothetical protein